MTLLARMFGADLRSLAVFRIVLGVIVLLDLIGKSGDARTLYSDDGIFLRTYAQMYVSADRWSLMFANGSVVFTYAFLLITAATAICVMLGYRTRLAVIVLWILVISIQTRNPYHLFGADTLTRSLLFWGMFLPLGSVWSLDSKNTDRDSIEARTLSLHFMSVGTLALFLQIAFMYWFTMLLKTGDEWRSDFTALWWTYGSLHLASPFGHWLQQFPEFLKALTLLTTMVETVAPFLLFIPFRNGKFCMVGIVALMGLHVGILLTLTIGIFPAVSALCMVCFLPSAFWDAYLPRIVAVFRNVRIVPVQAPRMAPGGFSAFMSPFRHMARTSGPASRHSFATLQGNMRSVPADTRAAHRPAPLTVASSTSQSVSSDPKRTVSSSLLGNLAAAFCLLLVLGYNVSTVSAYRLPQETRPITSSLGLYQSWAMFAPSPPKNTRWHVLAGTTESGEQINLLRALTRDDFSSGDPLNWDTPDNINTDYYGDIRWRRFFGALDDGNKHAQRARMATYSCQSWNALHPDNKLTSFLFIYVAIPTTTDGSTADFSTRVVSTHTC